jgi:predicted adenylyl cyclase CyaB
MPANVEIKARVENIDALRARARSLAGSEPEVLNQVDTFFTVPGGRFKLRRLSDSSGELIFYRRPDQPGPKRSSYFIYPTADPGTLALVLARALDVRGVVEKRREVYQVGQTRIHIDEVRDLGQFLELEVVLEEGQSTAEGERIANDLLQKLEVPGSALVSGAYIDLLEDGG